MRRGGPVLQSRKEDTREDDQTIVVPKDAWNGIDGRALAEDRRDKSVACHGDPPGLGVSEQIGRSQPAELQLNFSWRADEEPTISIESWQLQPVVCYNNQRHKG